jgi:hypothetical protein
MVFHFQNVTYESLDDIYCSKFSNGCNPHVLGLTSVPWPAANPELNPIEHIWDLLGRRIQAQEPPVQNLRQLEAALQASLWR